MIAPGQSEHRSGGVAKDAVSQFASRKIRIRLTWILNDLSRAKQALGRGVRDPAAGTADAVAERLHERSGKPVQTDLAKRGWRSYGGHRCRAVHALRKPERRTITPGLMPIDTGAASALGWISLTTRDSSGASSRLLVLPFALR